MNNEQILKYRRTMRDMFNTAPGQDAIKLLADIYVNTSCLGANAEETYYRLGQKEMVQGLLRDAESTDEEFENLIESDYNEY